MPRLIDADSLIERMKNTWDMQELYLPVHFMDLVEDEPTVEEQETVTPQVLIDTWICGNCKTRLERQSMIGPDVLIDENFNYCPCCGKKVKWDEQ